MQKISEDDEGLGDIPLNAVTEGDELDHVGGTEADLDLMAERDFDWALGYGTAPYACGNVVIQLTDITFHVLVNQTDALHIVANCVIIVWVVNFLYNYIEISRWRTVGFSVILIRSSDVLLFRNSWIFERSRTVEDDGVDVLCDHACCQCRHSDESTKD